MFESSFLKTLSIFYLWLDACVVCRRYLEYVLLACNRTQNLLTLFLLLRINPVRVGITLRIFAILLLDRAQVVAVDHK